MHGPGPDGQRRPFACQLAAAGGRHGRDSPLKGMPLGAELEEMSVDLF